MHILNIYIVLNQTAKLSVQGATRFTIRRELGHTIKF